MKCAAIRELLSAYMDGVLDERTRTAVAEHLAACRACAEELSALKAVVAALGALEPVKPPEDFPERLRARTEPQHAPSRLLRKLFVPFWKKIPLELAAAAATAVLVFSMTNLQREQARAPKAPEVSTPMAAARRMPPIPAPVPEKAAPAAAPTIELALVLRPGETRTHQEPLQAPESPAVDDMDFAAAGRERTEVRALKEKASRPATSAAEAPGLRLKGRPREGEVATPKTAPGPEDSLSAARDLIEQASGRVLSVTDGRQGPGPKILLAEIPASGYASLCKELTRLGTLRPPVPPQPAGTHDLIRLRILLLDEE